MGGVVISYEAARAVEVLGDAIRIRRHARGWTVAQLADRLRVSRPTVYKIEKGDPGVAMGTVFDAAALVGVPLFSEDPALVGILHRSQEAQLALLPARVRAVEERVDDDF